MDRAKSRLSFIGVFIAALLVAFLGMLAIVGLGYSVDMAHAEEHTHDGFTAWEYETSLPGNPGSYYLTKDVTISSTWTVPSGDTTNLCLNGHSIKMTGSGSVIIVSTGATFHLFDCDDETVHYFTPSTTGVASLSSVATDYSFIGGYITGGTSTESRGGGLRITGSGSAVISGGTIFGNRAGWGGGIFIMENGTLTIEGTAKIIGNYSSGAYTSGGGIFMEGNSTVTMTDGSIRYNSAQYSGGGVRDSITGDYYFTMTGGEITGNYSGSDQGNGFCFDQAMTFKIGGSAKITGNQGTNELFVTDGRTLTIVEPFTDDVSIGIKMQKGTGVFTSGWAEVMGDADPADYFTSDNAAYSAFLSADEAQIGIPPHEHDGITFTAWTSNNSLPGSAGSYYLTTDVTISSTWTVPSGTTNLCLNGHGIRRTGNGNVILVGKGTTLKLYECDTETEHRYSISSPSANGAGVATVNDSLTSDYQTFKGGYITGGCMYGGYGAGINLEGDGATLYMYGGTIIGNSINAYTTGGGGVCVQDWDKSGGFYMYGGSIIGNTANYGGGVYVRFGKMELFDGYIGKNVANRNNIGGGVLVFSENSTLVVHDGVIANNYATQHGGAVEASGGGTVTINGGNFTNNMAGGKGGALTNQRTDGSNSPATFNISGAPVFSGNSAGQGNEIYLCNTAVLNLTAALTNTTKIGITKASGTGAFTSGWKDVMDDADPADYFTSDDTDCVIGLLNGEAAVLLPMTAAAQAYDGTYDGAAHGITVTPSVEEVTICYGTSEDDCTLEALTYTDVGTYTVYYVVTKSGYVSVKGSATVTITKKAVTVTADAKEKTYGDVDLALTASVTGLVDGDSLDYSLERAEGENVDEYVITVTLGDNPNYDVTPVNGKFTINKKAITVTADTKEKTYGDLDPALTYEVVGLVGEDILTGALARAEGENAGTYAISQGTLANDNYNIEYRGANLTINKKSITVTADAKEKTYGDADPTLTYTSDKLVGTDAFSGALSRAAGEKVGEYTITLGTLSAGANYDINYFGSLLIITQKTESKVDAEEIAVTVVGLDKEAQEIKKQDPTAGEISVVMTVEKKTEEEIAEEPAEKSHAKIIQNADPKKNFEFYEITVEKRVDGDTTFLKETSNVIEIAIPYAKAHKSGLTVYSYHDNEVVTFTESDSKEAGTFRVDKENKIIYVYANSFSTYAIGYTPYYRVATAVDLGTYTGNADVVLINRADGTTYTQEDVDPANIVFADVPKGQYVLTVTWTDGAKNTISMPMAVGFTTVLPLPEEEPAAEPEAEAPAAAEETPVDPVEEAAKDLEDVVMEERKYGKDIFALPKRDSDRDDA